MSTVYGTCKECGATPIDDRTELCEECEREARISGELDDPDDDAPGDDSTLDDEPW
jgi:hypothetical protein